MNRFSQALVLAREFFPLYDTLRTYRFGKFKKDLPASITVALLDVPQAMAYALIAGLPPQYGLYSSMVLGFVGAAFSNSQHVISGPTNAIALITASSLISASPAARENPVASVVVLTLMIGIVQLSFGLLRVGNLSQFVSRSVLVGFTSGAGLLIAVGQLPSLFGQTAEPGSHLVEKLALTFANPADWNIPTLAVAAGTIAILLVGKHLNNALPWALIAVVVAGLCAHFLNLADYGVAVVGAVPPELPSFAPPPFKWDLYSDLAAAALAIAILGCIESLSIAKSISVSSGQKMNNNQDFIGMGLAHMVGAFFSCMPGCGSFTRSALNYQSGAATRLSGMMSSLWVAAAVVALGPAAAYIPKAALAGMLVVLGLGLIHFRQIKISLKSTRSDAAVLLLTFFATLFLHLDTAIYIGVIASLVLFLRKASAPHLVEYDMGDDSMREIRSTSDRTHPEISIIHVEGELFFGAAELFESQVRRLANDGNIRVVILRMKNARHLDATAVMALDALREFLKNDNRLLLISGASPEVMRVLTMSGFADRLGTDCLFEAEENLTAATRRALLKAREFLGTEESPEVRVFYDESRATKGASTKKTE